MAELPEPFIPADIPVDDRSFEPVPEGKYILQVIESKLEETKSGSGQMLVLTLEIIDGEYVNRRIWDRLNIVNQNPMAQHIAKQSLRLLCIATGVVNLQDTNELHFKPFKAKVSIRQDKSGQYGPQNRVQYIADDNDAPPPQKAPARASKITPPPLKPHLQAKAEGAKPWSKPQGQRRQVNDDEAPF